MIQRIQTLFMILAMAALVGFYFYPITTFTGGGREVLLHACYLTSAQEGEDLPSVIFNKIAPFMAGLIVLGIVASIFMYKNRQLQIRIGNILTLALLALVTFMLLTPDKVAEKLGGSLQQEIGIGYYLPIIALIFLITAVRFIKKDDELVRSADRLR